MTSDTGTALIVYPRYTVHIYDTSYWLYYKHLPKQLRINLDKELYGLESGLVEDLFCGKTSQDEAIMKLEAYDKTCNAFGYSFGRSKAWALKACDASIVDACTICSTTILDDFWLKEATLVREHQSCWCSRCKKPFCINHVREYCMFCYQESSKCCCQDYCQDKKYWWRKTTRECKACANRPYASRLRHSTARTQGESGLCNRKLKLDLALHEAGLDTLYVDTRDEYKEFVNYGRFPQGIQFITDLALHLARRCPKQVKYRETKLISRLKQRNVNIKKAKRKWNYLRYVKEGMSGDRIDYDIPCTCGLLYGCSCERIDWHTIKREDNFPQYCECGTTWGCICTLADEIQSLVHWDMKS